MSEAELQRIERHVDWVLAGQMIYSDVRALITEVRRLREQNEKLDPYQRGVVERATDW